MDYACVFLSDIASKTWVRYPGREIETKSRGLRSQKRRLREPKGLPSLFIPFLKLKF
jgi:hypothetical protein